MDRIRNGNLNIMKILGIVFIIIGAIQEIVGIVLYFALRNVDMELNWLTSVILCGVGLIFLVLGLVFLIRGRRRQRMEQELKARGEAVYADVTGISLNYSVSLNGRHPYFVEASYRDPSTGTVHVFRSHDLGFDPSEYVRGQRVAVYCRSNDLAHYYMDIDALLPNIRVH